jgi:hypothetical protein
MSYVICHMSYVLCHMSCVIRGSFCACWCPPSSSRTWRRCPSCARSRCSSAFPIAISTCTVCRCCWKGSTVPRASPLPGPCSSCPPLPPCFQQCFLHRPSTCPGQLRSWTSAGKRHTPSRIGEDQVEHRSTFVVQHLALCTSRLIIMLTVLYFARTDFCHAGYFLLISHPGQTFPVFGWKFDMGPLQYKGALTLFSIVISANLLGRKGKNGQSKYQ